MANRNRKQRPTKPSASAPPWRPFPVDVLPEPVRAYVTASAAAIGCNVAYVAVAVLSVLAAAIGNSREIRLNRKWAEPAVIWIALVGESGTQKSPAIDAATEQIKRMQSRAFTAHQQAMKEYKTALANWKNEGKNNGEEAPAKPTLRRYYCSDTTIEALAERLGDTPRGLLLIRDEMAGWFASFDQYRASKGADVSHWLTLHGARDLLVDRKTGDKKVIFVPRAAVSICGGIQPDILRRALGAENFENGLAARLLLAMPPRTVGRWTDADVDEQVEREFEKLLGRLYALKPEYKEPGQPQPVTLGLTTNGKSAWVQFFNQHATELAEATGRRAALLAKIQGVAARLALILQLAQHALDDHEMGTSGAIDAPSIEAGVKLARWFANEGERVYSVLQETDEDRHRRQIVELIQRNGGRITAADLRRRRRELRKVEDAEQVLTELSKAGLGSWEPVQPGPKGGHPTRQFVLRSAVSVSETPSIPEKHGGFGCNELEINRMFREADAHEETLKRSA